MNEIEIQWTKEQDDDDDEILPNNTNVTTQQVTNVSQDPPLISFLTGMKNDLQARLPLYWDDWSRPDSIFTVLNATIFAFVIQLIPALIFAELMASTTGGNLATAEVLLSTAIMGVLYAILSGQPLVIMGVTGPVAILLGTSYNLAEQFNADYFPFFAWTCIWAGLMHIVSAMLGLVSLVWTVTPFTSQIFELFIAITFIYSSVQELIHPIFWGHRLDRAEDYAQLLIGFVTFYIAWTLHFAESWKYFSKQIRIVLASYNTLLAVIIGTALSYVPTIDHPGNAKLLRVRVVAPWDWQPTADRNWFIDPFSGVEAKAVFAAMIPGLMFFLLFIIDHNVSSILTQSPKLKLKKPCAYHWDFFILGITFFPCALLGLPPGNGLIPQAPLHARALCRREYSIDKDGVPCEVVVHVEEQRWSGLGQALLMFVALASFRVISWIPRGCLFGLFLYLGCGALYGNAVFERFLLCFVAADKRPTKRLFRLVEWKHVQLWTSIQAICALMIFGVAQFASVGYLYPALLALLVPLRSFILERYFSSEDLGYLDFVGEEEEVEDLQSDI